MLPENGREAKLNNFTPISSALGGVLIGLSAALLLLSHGRIAGISGITGGLFAKPSPGDVAWRWAFLFGLLCVGFATAALKPDALISGVARSWWTLAIAGLLVGFGTRLGGGCTSGHGVCGIGRGSVRSLLATITFVIVGAATVFAVRHWGGGFV